MLRANPLVLLAHIYIKTSLLPLLVLVEFFNSHTVILFIPSMALKHPFVVCWDYESSTNTVWCFDIEMRE